jgi:hypothetical protein
MDRGLPRGGPRALRIALALAAAAALVAVALGDGGCSSGDGGSPPPPCPLPSGADDDFCAALATYDGRCGHCDDCTGKNLRNCTKRGASMSAAHRAAFIACKESMPCADGASHVGCVAEQMAKAVPTPVQVRAKDAYCAACNATNPADCAGFFSVGSSPGKNGAGYTLLLASDRTAERAVTLCSSKCNPFDYGVCVALIGCTEAGGDFCVDSGFCAPQ